MNKKIIAVDMDDTLVYLMKEIMKDHNHLFPEKTLRYEQLAAFDTSMFHPEYDKIKFFQGPDVFYRLPLMDDHVVPEMKKLHQDYDVLIVTSAFPYTVNDKWRWIEKHLPFIPLNNFITCNRKDLVQADILIDDAEHNVKKWIQTGRPAIVPSHHWNQHLSALPGVKMANGWKGMKSIVDSILKEEAE